MERKSHATTAVRHKPVRQGAAHAQLTLPQCTLVQGFYSLALQTIAGWCELCAHLHRRACGEACQEG